MATFKHKERLSGVHPALVKVLTAAEPFLPFDVVISEGLRTKEKQAEYVKKGASKTMNSRHLTGHAVDLLPAEDATAWPLYNKLAAVIKAAAKQEDVAIVWGGDWKSFKDGPHWELSWKKYPAPLQPEAPDDVPEEEPQRDSVTQTNTFKGATLTGTVTTLAAVSEGTQHIQEIKEVTKDFGFITYLPIIFSLLALCGVGYLIWNRAKDFKNGRR